MAVLSETTSADTRNSLYGLLLLIVSYPIYRLVSKNAIGVRLHDQTGTEVSADTE